ncbi:hypothetical protein DFR24_0546 [Panacagrimonas perspica]|uniref:Uncharacterized protein n=1 Tax=Panacagrimonas perspica TaxID=381431 RepID=A0A4R7PB34_9GAMM|nr:hypothetical protein [Panacagrimonas perspica]TDU31187.1 hypothetical protein DFR24_0546 [Panacagrimonas perspica]THD01059.1 hypothetical protein B1810_21800 [Panacagrimonas perspica]
MRIGTTFGSASYSVPIAIPELRAYIRAEKAAFVAASSLSSQLDGENDLQELGLRWDMHRSRVFTASGGLAYQARNANMIFKNFDDNVPLRTLSDDALHVTSVDVSMQRFDTRFNPAGVMLGASGIINVGSAGNTDPLTGPVDIVLNATGVTPDERVVNEGTINTSAAGSGVGTHVTAADLDVTAVDGITLNTNVDTLTASAGAAIGIVETDGVELADVGNTAGGIIVSATTGAIDASRVVATGTGNNVALTANGAGGSISAGIISGGNVGLITLPLSVDGGVVAVDFTSTSAVAFVSGVFGSLNESSRVLGLGANSVLSSNVGSIQSSFEECVSFKLDSSQFATQSLIFSIEGTGILPPEDQRE